MTAEELLSKEISKLKTNLFLAKNKRNVAQKEIDDIEEKIRLKKNTLDILVLAKERERRY